MGKRMGIDALLTASLLLLMSFRLFGRVAHEWLGLIFLGLFVWHHAINRHFFTGLFRGRYDAARVVRVLLMILLGVAVLVAMGSGIATSRHAVPFLSLHGAGRRMAAHLHVVSAYWCFVFAGIHAGLYGSAMMGAMRRKFSRAWPALRFLGWALAACGAWAFVKRGVADYLFLRAHFASFPGDNLPLFLMDYAAMFVLFAGLGRGLSAAFRR